MGNEIKTTMTMDQQQMLRELQRQNVALQKNARAFLDLARAGKKSGDDIGSGFNAAKVSVSGLLGGIVGVTSAMGAAQAAIRLVGAEYDKITKQAQDSAVAWRTPADAMRRAVMNVAPQEMDWLVKIVPQIAAHHEINAKQEIVAGVVSSVRSAAGTAELAIVEKAVETALRTIGPNNPQAAEQLGIALMNVLTTEQRFNPNLTDPRAVIAAVQMLGTESHPKDIENTTKSFGGLHAAYAQFGQGFRETAAMFAAVTNEIKDQTGEVSASGLRETGQSLMNFAVETDEARKQRITTEFEDALAHTDFIGSRDAQTREKLKDRLAVKNLKTPEEHGQAAIELLEESQAKVRPGSDDDKLIAAKIAKIRTATTSQQSTDIRGNRVDVPMEQVRKFESAKTPFEKFQVLRKTPELGSVVKAKATFGRGKVEEFMKSLIDNDAKSWRQIEEPLARLASPTNEMAEDFEKWLTKVNAMRGQFIAKAQNTLETSLQTSKLNRTSRARHGIAKETLTRVFENLSTSVAEDWFKSQVMPFIELPEMRENPEDVAIRQIEKGLSQTKRELRIGQPKDAVGKLAQTLDRLGTQAGGSPDRPLPHPSGFEPFSPAKREDYEEDIRLQENAIQQLKRTKAEATQQRQPAQKPVPAGQPVSLIRKPIKQRLRPDIDFMLADTGGEIARQMQAAQRQPNNPLAEAQWGLDQFWPAADGDFMPPADPQAWEEMSRVAVEMANEQAANAIGEPPQRNRAFDNPAEDPVIAFAEKHGIPLPNTQSSYEGIQWRMDHLEDVAPKPGSSGPVKFSAQAAESWARVKAGTAQPFTPSDPERVAKANAAMVNLRDRKAANPMAKKKPFTPSDPERVDKAWEAVRASYDQRESFAGHESVVAAQGADNKPVVSELSRQTVLLEQIAKAVSKPASENKSTSSTSRGGRERTSTRPAAALAGRG